MGEALDGSPVAGGTVSHAFIATNLGFTDVYIGR